MRQRIGWGEGSERQGCADGLVELAGITEGANETVMRLNIICDGGDGGSKGLYSFSGLAGGEQVKTALGVLFGGGSFGLGHG